MTQRKFYKTLFMVEILSEEPIPESMPLDAILREAAEGDYSGIDERVSVVEIDGKAAAEALQNQESDPGFFRLTPEGEDIND